MKQFFTIFKFELGSILKNKVFVGFTIVAIILLSLFLSYPRAMQAIKGDKKEETKSKKEITKIAVSVDDSLDKTTVISAYQSAFTDGYKIIPVKQSEKDIKKNIKDKKYDGAFIVDSLLHYSYVTDTNEMYDSAKYIADECMEQLYKVNSVIDAGVEPEDAYKILNQQVKSDVIITGKDQTKNFSYTYVILFLLYMALIIYGQFVAQSVASEKSSRTMEVLITSAKPTNMMFGKVLGSGLAGLIQLSVILFSAFGMYSLNKEFWKDNMVVDSVFDMPLEILLYTILFFILGFFIYAFMYGALGSLASKSEDLNTLILPVTFIFIIAFITVVTAMSGGKTDGTLMKVLSFIPFTSPMAMLARISMTTVPAFEIIISVAILVVSEILIGYLSAVIYRTGVLMYGNKPSIKNVFSAMRQKKKS